MLLVHCSLLTGFGIVGVFVVRFSELWTEEFSFSWQKRTELVFTPGRGVGWGRREKVLPIVA